MNAAGQAQLWFRDNGQDFAAALLHCLFHGHVIGRPDFLLLAEEVLAYPKEGIVAMGPDCPKNCWFLWYLGHDQGLFTPLDYCNEAPYPHRYVAYRRKGKVRVREWNRLLRDFNVLNTKEGALT
jgi:hypothetical protein